MRGITEHHRRGRHQEIQGQRRPPWLLDQTVTNWWWFVRLRLRSPSPVITGGVIGRFGYQCYHKYICTHYDWQFTDNWKTQSRSNYRIPPPSARARLTEAGHPQITMERIFISTRMHPGHVTLHPRHDTGVFESFVHCHYQPPRCRVIQKQSDGKRNKNRNIRDNHGNNAGKGPVILCK